MWMYRRYITTKDGRTLDAHWYGKKVFRFWVDEPNEDEIA